MDTINIEVREMAEKRQLYFHGMVGEAPAEQQQPLGAGAGDESGATS